MSRNVRKLFSGGMLAVIICCTHTNADGQRRDRRDSGNVRNVQRDTNMQRIAGLAGSLRADAPKPYKDIITAKAVSYRSFITVHKVDDKYFLEVPDAMLGREILSVNQISSAPADFRTGRNQIGYAGDAIGQLMFHFEKGEGNRLFIRMKSYKERAADSSVNGLARSLERNNMEPILNSYPVKAVNDSAHSTVVEITDQLNQDNLLFGFSAAAKTAAGLGPIVADRSYIGVVKGYEDNISFAFTRTYTKSAGGFSTVPLPYTFQLRSGMILLPQTPMTARASDRRTAYQDISYTDFDNNPLGVISKGVIYRWRLEPVDRRAYLSGSLTAPLQPVRIYMDAAMPVKWRPYIKAGIEAWNEAFKKAGFKDVIEVVQSSSSDGASYFENIYRNTVVFMPGEGEDPGNIIVDPRSGEILNVQLRFYLSTLDKLYKKYFIQAGALDKAANKPVFDDALMGSLVQAYTMQTMGVLLGLKANTGASYANSIAHLRSNSWLRSNAFNGSATDPVLVNYVVQPEDQVDVRNLLPKISEADEWMINWGYRVIPENEPVVLDKWIVQRAASGAGLFTGDAPKGISNAAADPRSQPGDLSKDVVQASILGINNLKRVVPNLLAWTSQTARGNARAGELYEALLDQYAAYAANVTGQIGGVYVNMRNSNQPGAVYSFVPLEIQKRALQFLQNQVFQTPSWLVNKPLYSRTAEGFDSVMNIQRAVLEQVLSRSVMTRLLAVMQNDPLSAYHPLTFLNDLSSGIFSELKDNQPVSLPRRELQRVYVTRLLELMDAYAKADNDLPAILRSHARELLDMLKQRRAAYTGFGQTHISAMYERLCIGMYNTNNPSPATRRN